MDLLSTRGKKSDSVRRINLTDPNPPKGQKPEKVKLLVVEGGPEDWGEFESLRDSSWAAGVKVIPADALANALHGHLMPLLRELGRDPRVSARRVSDDEGHCQLKGQCSSWDPEYCKPGGQRRKELGPPDCYEPPLVSETRSSSVFIFKTVARAWKEGRHTIVVRGEGFNFR